MAKTKRRFTPEERLSILQEGINGLKDKHKKIDPEVRALELENERLNRIIAKQALEIEVESELLKKIL
jgi:regulator of replication initiation timing